LPDHTQLPLAQQGLRQQQALAAQPRQGSMQHVWPLAQVEASHKASLIVARLVL
jgi:hypothetical protein